MHYILTALKMFRCIIFLLWSYQLIKCEAFSRSPWMEPSNRISMMPLTRSMLPTGIRQMQQRKRHGNVLNVNNWEGDDLRWSTRLWRRLRRRSQRDDRDRIPVKTTLGVLMVSLFIYQVATTVNALRQEYPSYWPSHALGMIIDCITGSSLIGPLMRDFGFSNALSLDQPHRYVTSAFFHGGILHLLLNLDIMRRQPSWLESGLGGPIYLTTFLLSTVLGNLGHLANLQNPFDATLCLGAGSGLCGLYGFMFVCLLKMGNRSVTRKVAPGLLILIGSGMYLERVSTMANISGFGAGIVMGILFSPSYKKSYSMRRKNSVEYDPVPRDFRQAMGFGVMPTKRGLLPLPFLWVACIIALALSPQKFHMIPATILKGFLFPGSIS